MALSPNKTSDVKKLKRNKKDSLILVLQKYEKIEVQS
jgi:hypothetical protein